MKMMNSNKPSIPAPTVLQKLISTTSVRVDNSLSKQEPTRIYRTFHSILYSSRKSYHQILQSLVKEIHVLTSSIARLLVTIQFQSLLSSNIQ
ncbi:hypothetical protein CDAR_559281 [Caerostris darwini]|uniref:Uncharacterized protein n=1 Tax=Caerostris darwini TaxID=1538125 RepID=A0AAV4P0W9_9ARAC|nr:hypothetical protein CDAR_559281 [Caerostris darwini]